MTVISALKTINGDIYIGADKMSSTGVDNFERIDSKLIIGDNVIVGVAGSYRVRDLLYANDVLLTLISDRKSVINSFIPEFKNLLSDEGLVYNEGSGDEFDGQLLIGVVYEGASHIYKVGGDFQVGEYETYSATGSGTNYARVALECLHTYSVLTPYDIVAQSIIQAGKCSSTCGTNYEIYTLTKRMGWNV